MKQIPFLLFILFTPLFVFAATIGGDIVQPNGTVGFTGVGTFIASIIAYAIGFAGILGVIGITWGGIQMILSTGDDEKTKKGKFIMIYSIVGVILAGLAYGIVNLIGALKIG